jgi:hypothetical protein
VFKKMSTDSNRNLSMPDNAKPLLSLLNRRNSKPVLLAIIAVLLGVLVLQLFALRADKSQALEEEFLIIQPSVVKVAAEIEDYFRASRISAKG